MEFLKATLCYWSTSSLKGRGGKEGVAEGKYGGRM